jgi:ATP-dependent DNA helicase RecG
MRVLITKLEIVNKRGNNMSLINEKIENFKIKGLGDKGVEKLKRMGVNTLKDILYFFPREYEDCGNIKKISEVKEEEFSVVKGNVIKCEQLRARSRLSYFKAMVSDGSGIIEAIWFKMPYLKSTIKQGDTIILKGKAKRDFGIKMVNPGYAKTDEDDITGEGINPIYPLSTGVNQRFIRAVIQSVIDKCEDEINEILPLEIVEKYKFKSRISALKSIHQPEKIEDAKSAKKRFAFEEIFLLEMFIMSRKGKSTVTNEYQLEDKKELVKKFITTIGFELTNAQKRVVTEIYKELKNGKIINRLIQGDVGSGKTIVAIILLLYMVENGYQGAFMAPTEILAEQHYLSMCDVLREIGVRVEILSGSVKGSVKTRLLKEIEEGLVDIVVGTHALIEDSVKFKKLAFIVIDEQHRFGVAQRQRIRDKGVLANLLVMSATPIPRSMALTIYGDLDVSIIDELPPGRIEIKTKWINGEKEMNKLVTFIKKKIGEGRQCYFVTPLIEESEKMELTSAQELYSLVTEQYFKNEKSALLHGKMNSKEKEEIMRNFKKGKTDILVSTTVIEVGVNVPNAVIMVVMNAERFGLAQLHQLRGRVGRGDKESFCFLVSNAKNEDTEKRLKIMEATTDGFEIAEEDLKLRKSGEIFGKRQSGISDLKLVDIIRDIKLIKIAKDEAESYLEKNRWDINNKELKEEIRIRYESREDKLGG